MADIHDLSVEDIKNFLKINKISDSEDIYDAAYILMMDRKTKYKNVSENIIIWMKANNLLLNNVKIPRISLYDIDIMSDEELLSLSDLLTVNPIHVPLILKYLHKLKEDESTYKYLPDDVLRIILNNLEGKNISSLLSITKNTNKLSSNYKDKIFSQAINRELKYTNVNIIKYSKLNPGGQSFEYVYDFKIGDRVIVLEYNTYRKFHYRKLIRYKNFLITHIKNQKGLMRHVNILGNYLDDEIVKIFIGGGAYCKRWMIKDNHYSEIIPGLLLFDNGPKIDDINSPYLKYIVSPINIKSQPVINITVTVTFSNKYQELTLLLYVVKYITIMVLLAASYIV